MQHGDLIVREQGALRRITLNRPKALNALTLDMSVTMTALLRAWAADPAVGAVLLDGAGERGLCAGGDIRALYDAAKSGGTLPEQFWAAEYYLDALIARYPKPFIAVMDGLVMGGGVGLSTHAAHRVVTERSAVGPAGSRHRLLSRHRRFLLAGAHAGLRRHLYGADRRAHERGRRDFLQACRRPYRVRKACRTAAGARRVPFGR